MSIRCSFFRSVRLGILLLPVLALLGNSLFTRPALAAETVEVPAEKPEDAKARHERVAERRQGIAIIAHRGSVELAHENTLEAYRATFELGGDGNEIDIWSTRDGVLVCFHDYSLDVALEAYGEIRDHAWEELRQFRFRKPGPFGKHCRIPTLVEVLQLHRQYAGLLHLDIKQPGLDKAIAELLDRMDNVGSRGLLRVSARAGRRDPEGCPVEAASVQDGPLWQSQ
jgi:glycerophosphoryl diester phosphodiesterase